MATPALTAKEALHRLTAWTAREASMQLGRRHQDVDDLMQEMLLAIWELGHEKDHSLTDYRHAARKTMWKFLRARRRV